MTKDELKTEFDKHFNFNDPHNPGLAKEFERQFGITPTRALDTMMWISSKCRRSFLNQLILEWQYDGLLDEYEVNTISSNRNFRE